MSALPTCGLERAAEVLHAHPSTVRELAKAGKIPGRKVGRAWVFVEADLLEFVREGECRSTSEGNVWWLDLADPQTGERIRESTGERERARAKRIHDQFAAELWKRRSGESLHAALDAWAEGKGEPDRYRVGKLKRLLPDGPLDP
jgi:excisionase family DNA binding protein